MKISAKGITVLAWILALMLAGWSLSQLPYTGIASQIALLSFSDWCLWLLVNALMLAAGVWRWQLLATALGEKLRFGILFRLRLGGSAVSFLTPGPHFGGEFIQLVWLRRCCGLTITRTLALLGLDRFLELSVNSAMLLAGTALLAGASFLAGLQWEYAAAVTGATLVTAFVVLAVILQQPQWLGSRLMKLAENRRTHKLLGNIAAHWSQLGQGLQQALSHRGIFLLALLFALLGWVTLIAELWLLLHFLGLTASPLELVLVIVALRLAMLLPMPGGIGTVEAAVLWTFQWLQWPALAAVGFIALIRLRDSAVLLTGLVCLFQLQRAGSNAQIPQTQKDLQ